VPTRLQIELAGVLALRTIYGTWLVAEPAHLTRRWLGPLSEPTAVALRALGAREAVLHTMALASALRGRPVRPFLIASAAGDLVDIAATIMARRGLPARSAAATVVVAGASAAESINLAVRNR